ncbi:MAG: PA0069 family radical SAM protein [Gammaproteobacteria bacterium]|nr:PA0069 family radical SAM protein [Gammaproteobacteria bacterium]
MNEKMVLKGRGAVSNPAGRFDAYESVPIDDGWQEGCQAEWQEGEDAPHGAKPKGPNPKTVFFRDKTRNLITKNTSPDVPFSQSINPYKGCEHGCVYCYARPTHAYLDLSPGLDFETKIFYKTDVERVLRKALEHPGYECTPIALGTNTDPYQPGERIYRVTRRILEILIEYRHPITIVTKGALILRDLDLLTEFARMNLVSANVSITTLDNSLKTKLEPRTASPAARLKTVRALHAAGIPVGVMAAPMIPFINDHELESIMAASVEAGARSVSYIFLRLPFEVKDLFAEWLEEHYPMKAEHVMNRVRDSRRGKAYVAEWGTRMRGEGVFAELLAKRWEIAAKRLGIFDKQFEPLRTDLFRKVEQLHLF